MYCVIRTRHSNTRAVLASSIITEFCYTCIVQYKYKALFITVRTFRCGRGRSPLSVTNRPKYEASGIISTLTTAAEATEM